MKTNAEKLPSPWVSAIPLAVLTGLLYVVIRAFGGEAINGGSQIALLSATSVCVMLSIGIYRCRWAVLEEAIIDNIRASASAIVILLLIGAIAGTWMISGVVPTMIYYGLQILHPSFFLVASCAICAVVSLMTGSSWTTIATIGVALMGIGQAMGFSEGWVAGAIISGAYFGDKLSLLSDTTVLASSTAGVEVFTHIRYMLYTTVPSMLIALGVFTVAGLALDHGVSTHAEMTASCSLRYILAFSLPWPIFSPLYAYHAPLFTTTPILDAKSKISPSLDIPLPNIISNSASLNGGATLFLTIFTLARFPIISPPAFNVSTLLTSSLTDE